MTHRILKTCGVMAISAASLMADFSYHESTKITGGMMAGAMKVAGVFSKQAREPMESTVVFKGNRMARSGQNRIQIVDLDKRTMTEVDLQKKTYSVMTFDEMKQAMENMSKKMKENKDADMKLSVSADVTGKTKQIAGFDAKEMLVKIKMETTDAKTGKSGSMVVYTDLWMAENVPGYSEVADFHKKMAAELNWTPGGGMFMAQPEVSKGMAEAFKEMSKLNGAPVMQVMAMGPEGIAPPSSDAKPAAQEQPKPSAGKVLGGALGSRLGGLGRKKSEPAEQQPQPNGQPAANQGALIEMQTEYSAFSKTADASLFDIPPGFKQVESEMKKMMK